MHFDPARLEPGQRYAFQTREWHGPATAVLAPAIQRRTFLGHCIADDTPCIAVARATGKTHVIPLASIEAAVPVQYPD